MAKGGGHFFPDSKVGPDGKFARADLPICKSAERQWKKSSNSLADRIERINLGLSAGAMDAALQTAETGISIFDPVLTELAYRWFCPPDGQILDPFAGGSVRGIVASKLGRNYTGVELRQEQVDANKLQGEKICQFALPKWICGTSTDIDILCNGLEVDMIFSCPPYADLEIYSDDPRDISNMAYDKFLEHYQNIITKSCSLLKPNRFAVFVVGEIRSKKGSGYYRGFVPDTVECFEKAGLEYYNEAILVTAVGSLPIRTKRMFEAGRKLGKTHQNVLVFCKGDAKEATKACGVVDLDDGLFGDGIGTDEQL